MTNNSSVLRHSRLSVLLHCIATFSKTTLKSVSWLLNFAVRLGNAIATLLHGLGHTLAIYSVTGDRSALNVCNVLEHQTLDRLLTSVLPGRPFAQQGNESLYLSYELSYPWQRRIVASAGPLANVLSVIPILFVIHAVLQKSEPYGFCFYLVLPGILAFATGLAGAAMSWPDLRVLMTGKGNTWACGPAFAIRFRDNITEAPVAPWSDRLGQRVEILAREASTRGGQSAGVALLAQHGGQPSIVFDKVVKGKRHDIVTVLCERLQNLQTSALREGYCALDVAEAALLHLRYATGGATHWHNAQPHWYEHCPATVHYRLVDGRLSREIREVFNLIAHNGDMDAVYLSVRCGEERVRHLFSQQESRAFLTMAMPQTTSAGDSDSRSIAEWVDFVYTQGLPYKALRYACFTTLWDFNTQIAEGQFDLEKVVSWAAVIDKWLAAKLESSPVYGQSFAELQLLFAADLRSVLLPLLSEISTTQRAEECCEVFVSAFFFHDLQWVMRQASRDLVGEYALMISTTLERRIGVFALTQAFSLGYNRTQGEIFGSAEPMGVTTALFQGDPSDDAVQYFLEDGMYAVVDLYRDAGKDPIAIYQRSQPISLDNSVMADRPAEVRWFPVNNNPKINRVTRLYHVGDEVERDLRDIPYVLQQISRSFEPNGENHRTASCFTDLLVANMGARGREPKTFDLVLYGVDFNEDLIRAFATELTSVLPVLRVQAENSGYVLGELKRINREGHGSYGKRTIFLGVSNSAQTQSTLAVARKATELVGVNRSFVLTQSFFNSMSQAIGQGYLPIDPIIPNTFVNLTLFGSDNTCGRRRSEAATVVPVATHAVLTEILLATCRKAISECSPDSAIPGLYEVRHDLQLSDLAAFREFQSAVYDVEIPNRVGFNAAGEAIDSPDTLALEREAEGRAENQIEYIRAYGLFAGYIMVATLFGVPLISTLTAPFAHLSTIHNLALFFDGILFLLAFWLIHLVLRFVRGRPLLERIGSRAEVYIDRRYIARIVERYNATLFANAPAFLTPFFYWADTVEDALHRFGIRAHRGVVTLHRIPDERLGVDEANGASEANMVLSQLGGIRFNGGQPQSRDKVRSGSQYVAKTAEGRKSRPYQTVLSDQLAGLRARYNGKLSPALLRLINRRLLDLADGLIAEFAIGYRRKWLVNRSLWGLISWLPGARWLYAATKRCGIDLMNVTGDADTANQAQIQSTKHPVSPLDVEAHTMQPRLSFSFLDQEQVDNESFAIVNFVENGIVVKLNGHALRALRNPMYGELTLTAGRDAYDGLLVGPLLDGKGGVVVGHLEEIGGQDCLVIMPDDQHFRIEVPLCQLAEEQKLFIYQLLDGVDTVAEYAAVA